MVQRERKTLNNAKQLLKKLRGDDIWIPCGSLYSKNDEALFSTEHLYNGTTSNGVPQAPRKFNAHDRMFNGISNGDRLTRNRNGAKPESELATTNGSHEDIIEEDSIDAMEAAGSGTPHLSPPTEAQRKETTKTDDLPDLEIADASTKGSEGQAAKPEDSEELERSLEDEIVDIVGPEASITDPAESGDMLDKAMGFGQDPMPNGNADDTGTRVSPHTDNTIPAAGDADHPTNGDTTLITEDTRDEDMEDGIDADDETKPSPRRMRTRAQAQAVTSPASTSRTASRSSSIPPSIHPLFKIPPSAIPTRDIGLPPAEAEETRRMLISYVQKQEEVCRGVNRLYEGLLKADRQRLTVLKWCKAEGHVGEMSDGEDWYDREEWGLEEEGLRKGHNDDEDEGVAQGKKTRGRRA